jgi:magnesium transporter
MLAQVLEAQGFVRVTDLEAIKRAYESGTFLWIDLEEQTPETDTLLQDIFRIHPLVIEDIWGQRYLPKIEDFEDYLYVLVHGIKQGSQPQDLELLEIDICFGKNWLITYHQSTSRSVRAALEECARSPKVARRGPAWIVHLILDHLVDDYLPMLDAFDEQIANLEDDIVEQAGTPKGPELMSRIFAYKKSIQAMRRISSYQREILLRLSRGEFDEIPADAVPFFRDVCDHFVRVTSYTETFRELLTSALEAYLSMQSNRMNEVMKTLTLMSTIMLPLTFIAGVYGMNFSHMPELQWEYGYPFALGLMAVVTVVILFFFRRRRWL